MARLILSVSCLIVVVLSFVGVAISDDQQGSCSDGTCSLSEDELRNLLIEVHQEGYKKGHEAGYQAGYQVGYERAGRSSAVETWGGGTSFAPSWGGESEMRWDSFDQLINPGRVPGTPRSR